MEKGGGKGYSQFSSAGLKSSQTYVPSKNGNLSKGDNGGSISNGGKVHSTKETQPPLELKLEDELPKNVKCLMDCEAAEILQGIQDQMTFLSQDPKIKIPGSFDKGLQYAKTCARYTNPRSVRKALETLSKYGANDGEICAIANVYPESVDETFALVPSLKICFWFSKNEYGTPNLNVLSDSDVIKSKKSTLEEPLKAALQEIAKLKRPQEA